MSRYETPDALKHDAHTLAEDAQALLDATSDLTDQKIAEARQRLSDALESGKVLFADSAESDPVNLRPNTPAIAESVKKSQKLNDLTISTVESDIDVYPNPRDPAPRNGV